MRRLVRASRSVSFRSVGVALFSVCFSVAGACARFVVLVMFRMMLGCASGSSTVPGHVVLGRLRIDVFQTSVSLLCAPVGSCQSERWFLRPVRLSVSWLGHAQVDVRMRIRVLMGSGTWRFIICALNYFRQALHLVLANFHFQRS